LGVLASFLTLAGLAIATQKAGGLANWGDAIRNPQFQVIITILITLVALNLFGVFEITLGGRALGAATGLASRQGFGGAFFNGVLATVLATPCTAPFLGAALAFAFTQPPIVTILIFLTVGFGLALPFVLICLQPRLLKFLPKPGAWMVRFKVAMGFPMMATAVWLLWVSARTEDDLFWLGLFLVVTAMAAWIWGEFVQRGSGRKGLAIGCAAALLLFGYFSILEGQLQWRRPMGVAKTAGIDWKAWTPDAVEAARREGHPALVDFTAKSCLNCKANKIRSIEIPETRAKLKEIGAVAFEADDTYGDPAIAQVLRQFDRAGVPLVLVYPKDVSKPPQVLPAWLAPSDVLNALTQAAN
jgi:thiol:disulfide interchange protein DsbD